jgi:hypothetical protein
MIKTFEEFDWFGNKKRNRIITHPEIDPLGEEQWEENPIPKEFFYKRSFVDDVRDFI